MMKMSKMATPPIMDPHTANILICYLLYKIDKPVQVSHLYDIAVGSNIINYFAYQDSISYLTEHNSVAVRQNEEAVDYYVLTENGIRTAKELRNYVGKAYRDKLVSAAFHYFARIKRESEVKIEYIPLKKGYYVHVRCLDIEDDLLHLIEQVHEIEGIQRIRLGSLEPKIVTEEFTKRLSELEKICPHFHLSLQSG